MIREFIKGFILVTFFVIATVIAAGAEQEKGGILMLAPCATDLCLETQSEPIHFFEQMIRCLEVAESHDFHDMESHAWCLEPMDETGNQLPIDPEVSEWIDPYGEELNPVGPMGYMKVDGEWVRHKPSYMW